eukprot:2027956-Rhodomonas_salina.1
MYVHCGALDSEIVGAPLQNLKVIDSQGLWRSRTQIVFGKWVRPKHNHSQCRQLMHRTGKHAAWCGALGPMQLEGGKLSGWLTCTCVGTYTRTQPRAVQAAGLTAALREVPARRSSHA